MSEAPGVERGFPIPSNEEERLAVLRSYQILDTQPESCYDEVVQMIQRILDVPIVVLSFLDADRQWFKAKVGSGGDIARGLHLHLCDYAIHTLCGRRRQPRRTIPK